MTTRVKSFIVCETVYVDAFFPVVGVHFSMLGLFIWWGGGGGV